MARYVTGERREIVLNYPELLYYRDVVFMFKFMMTPTSGQFAFLMMLDKCMIVNEWFAVAALPEIRSWMQNDADLQWRWDGDRNMFEVKAFNQV